MMDKLQQWRLLRNELDDMFKAREMKHAEAVKAYYKANPKDFIEKKSSKKKIDRRYMSNEDEFSYENCVEKKYWKKRPKSEPPSPSELLADHPDLNRLDAAIVFFEKLKIFIASKDCQKPEQWLAEHLGQNLMNSFRKEVINPLKKEMEDQNYIGSKDENGRDIFDF